MAGERATTSCCAALPMQRARMECASSWISSSITPRRTASWSTGIQNGSAADRTASWSRRMPSIPMTRRKKRFGAIWPNSTTPRPGATRSSPSFRISCAITQRLGSAASAATPPIRFRPPSGAASSMPQRRPRPTPSSAPKISAPPKKTCWRLPAPASTISSTASNGGISKARGCSSSTRPFVT